MDVGKDRIDFSTTLCIFWDDFGTVAHKHVYLECSGTPKSTHIKYCIIMMPWAN